MDAAADPVRSFRRFERAADGAVHLAGLAFGIAACAVLAVRARPGADLLRFAALAPYAGGLLAMLACSALYNMMPDGRWRGVFRRLDHAAIFLMIAGTYTPFTMLAIGGGAGVALLAFVWLVALAGAAAKLACPHRFERLSLPVYLLLGWCVVVALEPLTAAISPTGVMLLGAGGALYTVGVVFHCWRRLPFQTAIWHGFVLAGAATHYAAILTGVVPAG